MKKVIGIVSEGPTDYLVLKAVIDKITGEENKYLSLQPEPDMLGRYGNGWKGVWRWCKETESIGMLMQGIQPNIDAIVIQMDGDVNNLLKAPGLRHTFGPGVFSYPHIIFNPTLIFLQRFLNQAVVDFIPLKETAFLICIFRKIGSLNLLKQLLKIQGPMLIISS